jgi:hypothetical protein
MFVFALFGLRLRSLMLCTKYICNFSTCFLHVSIQHSQTRRTWCGRTATAPNPKFVRRSDPIGLAPETPLASCRFSPASCKAFSHVAVRSLHVAVQSRPLYTPIHIILTTISIPLLSPPSYLKLHIPSRSLFQYAPLALCIPLRPTFLGSPATSPFSPASPFPSIARASEAPTSPPCTSLGSLKC